MHSKGPLAGVRVLDMTGVVLGPLATQILGDYGADIIKVESLEGDLIRHNGFIKQQGMSSIFLGVNRNKRALAVDLKNADARAAVLQIAKTCDLFVHNMRVDAIERLGFGYEAVRAVKPDIVYCAAMGFGQDGPDKARPAFDDIIQAACGLALIDGDAPRYVSSLIADKTTGMAFANAILAALFHKERTGEGQYVEVPMLETMAAFIMTEHMGGRSFAPALGKAGYERILKGGRAPAQTRDGWIAVLPYTDAHWRAFLHAIGKDAIADEILVDRATKNKRVSELYGLLRAALATETTAYWLALCDRLDIPATALYTLEGLFDHPHLKQVGFFEQQSHETLGEVVYPKPAQKFSKTPASVRSLAPTLGQHNDAILREAGLSDAAISHLRAQGALSEWK
jgi:formyl-CoA transferase